MAHIKEPKGIDFIIKSEPLADSDRAAISAYINNYKATYISKKKSIRQTVTNNGRTVHVETK